jgi:hypothetical protein
MSMEIHVFSDKPLPPIAAWQQAIDAEGFDLKLDPDVEFETASGFLPAMPRGKQSGFESYHDDLREFIEGYAHVPYFKFCPAWKHALSFRWGSLAHEGVSVFMAATAYAEATDGVIYDPQEGEVLTLDEARACGRVREAGGKGKIRGSPHG